MGKCKKGVFATGVLCSLLCMNMLYGCGSLESENRQTISGEADEQGKEVAKPQEITDKEQIENSQDASSVEVNKAVAFPTLAPDQIEEETPTNPRSSYGLGSAAFLKGRNVLVSLFVTDSEAIFEDADKEQMLSKLSEAAIYIEETASKYGVDTELVYDWTSHPDLCDEAEVDFYIEDTDEAMDRLDERIATWVELQIPYEQLMQEYEAEGIATCIFVHHSGRSYAIVYDGEDNVKESLVFFSKNTKGEEENPAALAHEILHLYGAHDLYKDAEFSHEITDYVKKNDPDEIMLQVRGSKDEIKQSISEITAYHLGWIDTIPELKQFPELAR